MNNPKISAAIIYKRDDERINKFLSVLANQTFEDAEIFCAAYGLGAKTAEYNGYSNIKFVNYPENDDFEFVKHSIVDLLSGDYICILTLDSDITENYLQNIYYESVKNDDAVSDIIPDKLYRRSLIQNGSYIKKIIDEKYNKLACDIINSQKEEFLNFYKNNDNIVNNKVYDLTVRFNALEKTIYDKEKEIDESAKNIVNKTLDTVQETKYQFNSDISKVYDYINSEINKKGEELNKVYSEITNNYKYTEKLIQEAKSDFNNRINEIYKKFEDMANEQKLIYNNLQKLIDIKTEEVSAKFEIISANGNNFDNQNQAENLAEIAGFKKEITNTIDKMYNMINENNSNFYNELSELYREVNERITNNRN